MTLMPPDTLPQVPATPTRDVLEDLRPEALDLPRSGIEEVFNYGRDRQGLIPLWVGEGDRPTPAFICEAASRSMAMGETFYTYQAGVPELREAIADYMTKIYGRPFAGSASDFSADRFYVTIGGMHAIQMATRMVAGSGDDVLVPAPAWPNFMGAIGSTGAKAIEVPMTFEGHDDKGVWSLDLDRLAAATGPRSRALVVNSPSNPTGWVATRTELEALLEFSRRHRLWIIADEIYGRLVHDGQRAPSFHDIMAPDDRILFVQTLSKNWSMTGWRIGWLEAPPALGPLIETLVQYSTSGVPVPTQRAATAALAGGEAMVADLVSQVRHNRDLLCAALHQAGGFRFARPQGAFYLFCALERQSDSRSLALDLIDQAGIGVAPGIAFGNAGEGFVRLCFARKPQDIEEVARRFARWNAR
jgi:aspartate/methionine/tyrosine aminotransferase